MRDCNRTGKTELDAIGSLQGVANLVAREPAGAAQLHRVHREGLAGYVSKAADHQVRRERPRLGFVVYYAVHLQPNLFLDLARFRLLDRLTEIHEPCQGRVALLRPLT